MISKIIADYDQNYLISNINYTNLLCSIFLKKKNLKFIAIERTPFKELEIYFGLVDKIKKTLMRSLIGHFYKKFDLVICNSKYLGQYLKKYGISSKTLFPPSITYIRNTNKKNVKNNFKKAKVKIITVCRLSKEKIFMKLFEL